MSGLLGLLDVGAGAIAADSAAVAVAGRNTANVDTEGYSRESVDFKALAGAGVQGGVIAGQAYRAEDPLVTEQERQAAADAGASGAQSAELTSFDASIGPQTQTLVQNVASLFSGAEKLAAAPTDSALRSQIIAAANSIARGFRQIAKTVAQAQADADARLAEAAKQATEFAAEIANCNRRIAASAHPDPALYDQRDLSAKKLVSLMGGSARVDPDGLMRVAASSGAVMVDGLRPSRLVATPDPNLGGRFRIDAIDGTHVTNVTSVLTSGSIAGEIQFRDGIAAQTGARLDQLANDFATQVNQIHQGYVGLDGQGGRSLFSVSAVVQGSSQTIAVDPGIVGHPERVAAGALGAGPSDNQGALGVAALADQPLAAGATRTFIDEAISIGADVGTAANLATQQHETDQSRVDMLTQARTSVSGVSSDEELAHLAALQHASAAAGQFVSTVNTMLNDLINQLGKG